jgi:hypothetical protein
VLHRRRHLKNFFKTQSFQTGNALNTLTTPTKPLKKNPLESAKMSEENIYDEIEIEVRYPTTFPTQPKPLFR